MTAPLTITLPIPDHRLSVNRVRTNQHFRTKLVNAHKDTATLAALARLLVDRKPYFPVGAPLMLVVRVERRKRGQRWDYSGMVEACKPYQDGFNGLVYADDKQLVGCIVIWDEKPTGAGLVHLEVRDARELLATLGKG